MGRIPVIFQGFSKKRLKYFRDSSGSIELSSSTMVIVAAVIIVGSIGAFYVLSEPKAEIEQNLEPANFTFSNLEVSCNECKPGEDVVITFDVENIGGVEGNHTLELRLNGAVDDVKYVELGPGKNTTVSFTVSQDKSETYTVEVEGLSETFSVLKPAKFEVSDLLVAPSKVGPGENVTVTVDVANVGEVQGNYTVDLKVDGVAEKSRNVTLNGGENTDVSFTIQRKEIKFHFVEIGNLASRFEVVSYKIISEWGGNGGGGGLFNYPTGIAIDEEGYVYVSDTLNQRIQKFTPDGSFVTMWGEEGYGAEEFKCPLGIAVDSDGFVYVADGNSPYVRKFTSDGDFVMRWDAEVRNGIAVDEDGYVYVTSKDSVRKFTTDGNFVREWGRNGSGEGQFTKASGIAVHDGYIYVVELDREGNHRVQKFTTDGKYVTKWEMPEVCCHWWPMIVGITVDPDGNIYVSNPFASTIRKYTPNGNLLTEFRNKGSGEGELRNPQGLCIDGNGTLYVSDRANYRIQRFDDDFNLIDGWGSFGGSGSGRFNMPLDCDIYEQGDNKSLYVNEFWNCRIQKFTLDGEVVSLWGTLGRGSGEFDNPEALAVDNNGYVYVSDSGNGRVQKFDSKGNFITEWGNHGTGRGEFRRNCGIAVSKDGKYVYVVDMGNHRVQKFRSDGTFITLWKTEGEAEEEKYSPRGIAVDDEGYVYVSEQGPSDGYCRIQKFTADGNLEKYWTMEHGYSRGVPGLYDIAIDEEGDLYVLDTRAKKLLKFTSDGKLISKWEIHGNGIAIDSNGYVYVVNKKTNRLLKLILYE